MLTPLNIVSLNQGKMPSGSEADYYRSATAWRLPARIGRLIARLRSAAATGDAPAARGARAAS